jgi:hypothetical protein
MWKHHAAARSQTNEEGYQLSTTDDDGDGDDGDDCDDDTAGWLAAAAALAPSLLPAFGLGLRPFVSAPLNSNLRSNLALG